MDEERRLYSNPALYARVFPVEEEAEFFAELLGAFAPPGPFIDLGCGNGELTRAVAAWSGRTGLGIDIERQSLAAPGVVAGDILNLPVRLGGASAVISRLFGVAYAAGSRWSEGNSPEVSCLDAVVQTLSPLGLAALELPLHSRPARVQGLEEISTEIAYRFRYLDVLSETELGATLFTRIEVKENGCLHTVHAPLHVYKPDGIRRWAAMRGLDLIGFCASYDLETLTLDPPGDALRGIVLFRAASSI